MSLDELTQAVVDFRDERDWKQFHQPKDLGLALSIEVSELLEHFRFKNDAQIEQEMQGERLTPVSHELADILYFVLLLGHDLKIDLGEALREKLKLTAQRYPVDLCRGKNLKYTQL